MIALRGVAYHRSQSKLGGWPGDGKFIRNGFCGFRRVARASWPVDIEARWHLAASWAWQIWIARSSVRSFCCRRSSTVSPSRIPSMIWSRMFLWVQASEQKLQVFTSSRSVSKKSSKLSPGYWVRLRKLRRSMNSFM